MSVNSSAKFFVHYPLQFVFNQCTHSIVTFSFTGLRLEKLCCKLIWINCFTFAVRESFWFTFRFTSQHFGQTKSRKNTKKFLRDRVCLGIGTGLGICGRVWCGLAAASNEIRLSCFLFMAHPPTNFRHYAVIVVAYATTAAVVTAAAATADVVVLVRKWKLEIGKGCLASVTVQPKRVCVTQMIKDFILWLLLGCVSAGLVESLLVSLVCWLLAAVCYFLLQFINSQGCPNNQL